MHSQRSGRFLCVKWTLISVNILGIISGIIVVLMISIIVDNCAHKYPKEYNEDYKVFLLFLLFLNPNSLCDLFIYS